MPDPKTLERETRQERQPAEIEVGEKPGASEIEARRGPAATEIERPLTPSPGMIEREVTPRRRNVLPLLMTVITVAAAIVLGHLMWDAYMGAPWTRDGTVRAYVVTMAP